MLSVGSGMKNSNGSDTIRAKIKNIWNYIFSYIMIFYYSLKFGTLSILQIFYWQYIGMYKSCQLDCFLLEKMGQILIKLCYLGFNRSNI